MLDNVTRIADAAEFRHVSDGELHGLFRQWAATVRRSRDDGNEEWLDIEDKISATPAAGAVGLAIKVFLLFHALNEDFIPDSAALDDRSDPLYSIMELSAVRDLAAFVPELGPMVADAMEGLEEDVKRVRDWQSDPRYLAHRARVIEAVAAGR
jgi:hypothetical protein